MISADVFSSTPYKTPGTPRGRAVVIHATRSGVSMNPTEFEGTLNWFKSNPRHVSAHWVVSRTGVKARVAPDDWQTVHAGQHNPFAWGIELEQGVEADGFTPAQLFAAAEICKGYHEDFGVPLVQMERGEFGEGFVGHEDTPQGIAAGKSDPGFKFPWPLFMEMLAPTTAVELVEHYPGELNDRRWRESVYFWLATGELRGREVDGGRIELLDKTFQPFSPPVVLPLAVPDWGRAT